MNYRSQIQSLQDLYGRFEDDVLSNLLDQEQQWSEDIPEQIRSSDQIGSGIQPLYTVTSEYRNFSVKFKCDQVNYIISYNPSAHQIMKSP